MRVFEGLRLHLDGSFLDHGMAPGATGGYSAGAISLWLLLRSETLGVRRPAGFDEGLIKWGYEDSEFCLRLWLSGYRCVVQPCSEVAHLFRGSFPYEVDWETTSHNQLRTALLHLSRSRCIQVFDYARRLPGFHRAVAKLFDGDVFERRDFCVSIRKRSDDFLFREFRMFDC